MTGLICGDYRLADHASIKVRSSLSGCQCLRIITGVQFEGNLSEILALGAEISPYKQQCEFNKLILHLLFFIWINMNVPVCHV